MPQFWRAANLRKATERVTRPNFVVIGAMKAGTTSLYHYLRDHPQVFMCTPKEPHFFSRRYDEGLDWYEGLFADADERHLAIGEISVSYSVFPVVRGVPERIHAELGPATKLVYLLRHPIDRLLSHYYQDLMNGKEKRELNEAVLASEDLLTRSRYALQIERYLDHFPREQLHLVDSRDLYGRREETMEQIFGFLGVDTGWRSPAQRVIHFKTETKRPVRPTVERLRRSGIYRAATALIPSRAKVALDMRFNLVSEPITSKGALLQETRARLEELLHPDVERLKRYMPPSFDAWGLA